MRKNSFVLVILFFSKLAFCQNLDSLRGFEKYYRPSITFLFLNQPKERYNDVLKNNFSKIKVNDKFNDHRIDNKSFINYDISNGNPYSNKESNIKEILLADDIQRKVISKWYNQQLDGSFSMDFIAKRGLYNASDYDVMRAKAGARGAAELEDAGENLIKKSYILVFDFLGVETWDDFYDRQDAQYERIAKARREKPRKAIRTYVGYRGNSIGYLYKVNWDDTTQQIFYEKAWKNPAFFKKMNIPVQFMEIIFMSDLDGKQSRFNQYMSDNDLAQMLEQDAAESALLQLSKEKSEFRVKTSVFSTKPITAKVGKKESVFIDQPFFVYELVQGENDKKIPVKKGVIRATKKITDNRQDATGNSVPTQFYQESGKKIYPGMLIEQQYDIGGSFWLGWQTQVLTGPFIRLDYNLSSLFNVSQLRLYVQGYLGFGSVKFGNSGNSYTAFSRGVEVGMSKTYPILRNIHLEPNIGFIFDTTNVQNVNATDKDKLKTAKIDLGLTQFAFTVGLRMPINLSANVQLVPAISINTLSYSSNASLFGRNLPQNLPANVLGLDGNQSGTSNSNAHLGRTPINWSVSFRFKF